MDQGSHHTTCEWVLAEMSLISLFLGSELHWTQTVAYCWSLGEIGDNRR